MSYRGIPFHQPYIPPTAPDVISAALQHGNSLFQGKYNQYCIDFIKAMYQSPEVILTASCTDALYFSTLLLDLQPGDEVIIPSYTFVSVATAFANRGISIKLADSQKDHPNIDPAHVRTLITGRTRAVVFMSYAGVAHGVEEIRQIALDHNLWLIEDAAHSFNSINNDQYIGNFGHVSTFSFHESKSIQCGQGGMLLINDPQLVEKARSIQTHGANKRQFQKGLVTEYTWTSLGSEFNLPELCAALLYSQFQNLDRLQSERKSLWTHYHQSLKQAGKEKFCMPEYNAEQGNFYIFYIIVNNRDERNKLITFLKQKEIGTAFHYSGLHKSRFYQTHFPATELPNADRFDDCLLRLPLYPGLTFHELDAVCEAIKQFYK